jgi:hypothetical protein
LGVYPSQCELQAFTQAAIDACDGLDGLKDRIITDENACGFDPHTVVGKTFMCGTERQTFTAAAAEIVAAAWTGPVDPQGKRQWYGLQRDSDLGGLVGTTTLANGTTIAAPFSESDSLAAPVRAQADTSMIRPSRPSPVDPVLRSQEPGLRSK